MSTDETKDGMLSMDVGRVYCFFSFTHMDRQFFSCALIHWFDRLADQPNEVNGMWMVRPSYLDDGSSNLAVINVDSIIHAAHLLPIYGNKSILHDIAPQNSLDYFDTFYVNCFADHHTFELIH